MHKGTICFEKKQEVERGGNLPILDKLAQLGTSAKKGLKSKAKAKFFSEKISLGLANIPGSNLTKSYWNTFYCNKSLSIVDSKVTSRYCNARWCSVCNRVRIAKMINGYAEPLSKIKNAYFVTLTVPNCQGYNLRLTIDKMNTDFKRIMETMKKRKQRGSKEYQVYGIRKLECTYNPDNDSYHPHFHLLIDGIECAQDIVKEWLLKNPTCSSKAQDVRKADGNSKIELFKYFAKIVTKDKKGGYAIYINALDTIFNAMVGLRIFQPMGGIKRVTEEISDIISQYMGDLEDGIYDWVEQDWYDVSCGVSLTNYEPSPNILDIVNNFKV
jgi:hypothetical protein